MSVQVRTSDQLNLMRSSGKMTALALKRTLQAAQVGVSLTDLDRIAEDEILRLGGQPSFKTVPAYRFTTCLTLNDEVVHGLPRPIKLRKGDILGIDLGTVFKDWHTDAAWSLLVGQGTGDRGQKGKFLEVGEKALWAGVKQAVDGNHIGDISAAIQSTVEGAGYSVVRALVGHGVGRALHEEPEVPGFGQKGTGLVLKSGMTLAIEAIYTTGMPEVVVEDDGWTIASADGSLGGLFEMTIVVGKGQAEVLTDWSKV